MQLVYRLPQAVYDRMLPLTVEPPPEKVVRVGLTQYIVAGDPSLAERIDSLVRDLDAEDFDAREAATKRLAELGRAAVPHLRKLSAGKLSAEARSRIAGVLERHFVPAAP